MVAAPRILVGAVDVDVVALVAVVHLAVGVLDRSRGEGLHDALLTRVFERVVAVFVEPVALAVVVGRREDELFGDRDVELVRKRQVAVLLRVLRTVGGHLPAAAGADRGVLAQLVDVLDDRAVGVVGEECGADVRLQGVDRSLVVVVSAVFVARSVEADVVRVFQPRGHLGRDLGAESIVGVLVLVDVEHAVLLVEAAAGVVGHLVGSAREREVVLLLRTHAVVEIAVPVEIAVIVVLAVVAHFDPRSVGMLRAVVAAVVELLQAAVLLGVAEDVHRAVRRVVHKLVDDAHVVVTRVDEIGRGGVAGPAEAAVVGDARAFALLARLGGDEHHAGRRLGAVDGARRGVFEHRHRFDVVGVDLAEAHLHAVGQHERRTAVERDRTADVDGVGRFGGARSEGDVHRGVGALQGVGGRDHRTGVEILAADGRHGAREVGPPLRAVAHDDHLVHQVVRLFQDDFKRRISPPLLDFHDLGYVTQVGDVELGGEFHVRQFEIAVHPRQRTFLGAHDGHRRGDDRLSFDVGHPSAHGVRCGGRLGRCRGLFLGDGDAVSVDGAGHLLPGEYLVEDFADGGVFGRNGDAFGEVHLVRTDDDGVIFRTVQRGYGLLNGYVLQFEVDSLRLGENPGGAEQHTENNQVEESRKASSPTIAVVSHDRFI